MPTLDGITYTERVPQRKGTYREGSVSLPREFDVAWSDVDAFIRALLGGVTSVGGRTVRADPHEYRPGWGYWATRASFEGVGAPDMVNGQIAFELARVYADYSLPLSTGSAPGEDPDGEPDEIWGEERLEARPEWIQIPAYKLKWKSGGDTIEEPMGIPLVLGTLVLTRYNVSSVPISTYKNMVGKVNSATYRGFAAGTLLFAPFSSARTINVLGETSKYTVTIPLLWKPTGWKNMYRQDSSSTPPFEEVVSIESGKPLFAETSFAGL